jgi:cytoskeletal protein RodZ
MKRLLWPLAVVIVPAILGAAGLLVAHAGPPAPTAPPEKIATVRPTASPAPVPTTTNTASSRPRATITPRPTARPRPPLTDPWAVVSAYYRDVESHKYAKAWTLISSALAAEQTYQQFVAGYACTGSEQPTKLSQSGHQVSFTLAVVNNCTGAAQYYAGTDTVRGGKIVAADVTRTS